MKVHTEDLAKRATFAFFDIFISILSPYTIHLDCLMFIAFYITFYFLDSIDAIFYARVTNRATKMGSEIFHIQQVRQVGWQAIQAIGLYNWWCRRTLSLSGLEG